MLRVVALRVGGGCLTAPDDERVAGIYTRESELADNDSYGDNCKTFPGRARTMKHVMRNRGFTYDELAGPQRTELKGEGTTTDKHE